MSQEPTLYGFYSPSQAILEEVVVWKTKSGERVTLTEVRQDMTPTNHRKDAVFVGEVIAFVERTSNGRRGQVRIERDRRYR